MSKFKSIQVVCLIVLYLVMFSKFLSFIGFFDIDFKAVDELVLEQRAEEMSPTHLKSPFMPETETAGTGSVDINYATAEELEELPGIGKSRARAIVKQRTKMGGFSTLRDVLCTPGIGIEIFEKLEPYIKISQ